MSSQKPIPENGEYNVEREIRRSCEKHEVQETSAHLITRAGDLVRQPPQGHASVTSLLHGRCRRVGAGGEAPHALQGELAGFTQPAFLQQADARVQQRGYGYGSASLVRDDPPYVPRSLQCSCRPVQNRTSPCSAVLVAKRVRLRQRVPKLQ